MVVVVVVVPVLLALSRDARLCYMLTRDGWREDGWRRIVAGARQQPLSDDCGPRVMETQPRKRRCNV